MPPPSSSARRRRPRVAATGSRGDARVRAGVESVQRDDSGQLEVADVGRAEADGLVVAATVSVRRRDLSVGVVFVSEWSPRTELTCSGRGMCSGGIGGSPVHPRLGEEECEDAEVDGLRLRVALCTLRPRERVPSETAFGAPVNPPVRSDCARP